MIIVFGWIALLGTGFRNTLLEQDQGKHFFFMCTLLGEKIVNKKKFPSTIDSEYPSCNQCDMCDTWYLENENIYLFFIKFSYSCVV